MQTPRFNPVEVNSKHLVEFISVNSVNSDKTFWFYDFETSKWIQAKLINRLPYSLCSYALDGEANNQCIVTCENSYRLIEDLSTAPDIEWLNEQRIWREELIANLNTNPDTTPELDFIRGDNQVKAQVSRTKSDIVPNVLVISPRKKLGQMFGYYYYESLRLAKSCTYTKPFSQEELDTEAQVEENTTQILKKQNEDLEEFKSKLVRCSKFKCYDKYLHMANTGANTGPCGRAGFFDILEYYQSLNFYPHPITRELIKSSNRVNIEKMDQMDQMDQQNYSLYGTILFNSQGFEICHDENTIQISQSFILGSHDAFANIRIYGGTWAKLSIRGEGGFEISMDLVEDYLTFPDITLQNPMFKTISGSSIKIYTDGTTCSYNGICYSIRVVRLFSGIGNSYAITQFPSKNLTLFLGHCWQPSFVCQTDRIIPVEYIEKTSKSTGVSQLMVRC